MKQIYRGDLRVRLLYAVVIVLTTCLLIVGSAYRLKTAEADRLREDLKRAIMEVNAERQVREESDRWRVENGFTDTTDRRYGPGPSVQLLNEQQNRRLESARQSMSDLSDMERLLYPAEPEQIRDPRAQQITL